jgi:hypothetical protein
MTAPVGSETVPDKLAVCANSDAAVNTLRAHIPINFFIS